MKATGHRHIRASSKRIWSGVVAAAFAVVLGTTAAWGQYADEVVVGDGAPVQADGGMEYGGAPYDAGAHYGGGCAGCCAAGCGGGMGYGGEPYDGELWSQVHSCTRWWATISYIGLRVEGMGTPPLVTTSPAGTPQALAGVLPDATVLFGDERLGGDWRNGAEFRLGWWMVDGQFLALETHYMAAESEETSFTASGSFSAGGTGPILARPFIDATTGAPAARLIAFDNFFDGINTFDLDGSIAVDTTSEVQSAGALFRHILWADFERNFRLDFIGGYRFMQLDESLAIRETVNRPPVFPVGAITTERLDVFDAVNEFHGGEIGLDGEFFAGAWSLQLMGKVALGNTHQTVAINGQTTTTSGGMSVVTPGGVFATATNSGTFEDDQFAVLPEAHIRIRYDVTEMMNIFLGYRFLYLNEAARPGDQINLAVGGTQPTHVFSSTSVWMQALDTGVEFRW